MLHSRFCCLAIQLCRLSSVALYDSLTWFPVIWAVRVLSFLTVLLLTSASRSSAQQTVFNVPNADVLAPGKVYTEVDFSAHLAAPRSASWEPRVVFGLGKNVEAGLNVFGFSVPGPETTTIAPTFKWKFWNAQCSACWQALLGDDLVLPLQGRSYSTGNYVWSAAAKQWSSRTRISIGLADFQNYAVAHANRVAGQFTFEQPLTKRFTAAAEWWSGRHANGYFDPGVIIKASDAITLYFAYPLGNSGVTRGNHYLLFELGVNAR